LDIPLLGYGGVYPYPCFDHNHLKKRKVIR